MLPFHFCLRRIAKSHLHLWRRYRCGTVQAGQANTGGISEAILWTPVRDGRAGTGIIRPVGV
jgi:hypothetical protein